MKRLALILTAGLFAQLSISVMPKVYAAQQQLSGTTGVQSKVPADPPSKAPTISSPANNQNFTSVPITVGGLCQSDLLVQVFKNSVFAGSVQCVNGSYSLQIDLFSGKNDLVVRQYDGLNQASPDSNTLTVTYSDSLPAGTTQPTITSDYSKRGANPGEVLTWPITISGGTAPYALTIDWGDKTASDLKSVTAAGSLELKHTYNVSGIFNVIIRLSDANGQIAFLQLVGVGNGPIQQTQNTNQAEGQAATKTSRSLILPLMLASLMLPVSFWLGRRHDQQVIKSNLRQGKKPF